MKIRCLLAAACISLGSFGMATAHAEDAANVKNVAQAPGMHRGEMHEKLCAENPEQCAKMKARHEEMQKQCAADPKTCEAKKAEMQEKMKERMESHESMAKPGSTTSDKK